MNNKRLILGAGVVLLIVAGIAQFFFPRSAISPTLPVATSTPKQSISATNVSVATSTIANTTPRDQVANPLSIATGDSISSWDFKGAYADNPELTAKARSEILRLSELLTTATSSAMILSVGIANQYELLGDGKKQYEYLERAIRTNPENGLPWHNLGVLMERLGALQTARAAYEKSTLVQPEWKFYHYAYLEFLTTRMKNETATIEKAFAAAEKNIGKTQNLIDLRTEWQKP